MSVCFTAQPLTDTRHGARARAGSAPGAGRALSYARWLTVAALCLLPLAAFALETSPPSPSRSDSLRLSIETRIERIGALRDSLAARNDTDLDEAIEDLGSVFEELGTELSDYDLVIDDEMLKFTGPDGELRIDFPDNWGERVSHGLSAITATILEEMPDSLDIEQGLEEFREQADSWRVDVFGDDTPEPRRRKIVGDQIISTGDDVVVAVDERVAGSVVVLGADATILGAVDETVLVVGGELILGDEAQVNEGVVVVFGTLRRDEEAEVNGSVVSVGGAGAGWDFIGLSDFGDGLIGRAIRLGGLLMLGLLILLIFALLPGGRLTGVESYLGDNPGRSFIIGLVWSTVGHMMLALVLILLIVTVIGIPVAALLGLAYGLLGVVALGIVSRRLGAHICRRTGGCEGRAAWWTLLVGLALLLLPALLSNLLGGFDGFRKLSNLLGGINLALQMIVYCFGTGAVLGSRFGGERRRAASSSGEDPSVP